MADEPRDERRPQAPDHPGGDRGGPATGGHRATVIQLERPGADGPPASADTGRADANPPDAGPSESGSAQAQAGAAGAGPPGTGTGGDAGDDGAVVVVDDRMRRRRIAVGREAGRRRLRRIAWALAAVALLVDGAAILHLPVFDVRRVLVEGAERTPAATVEWASGIRTGDTLATLDEHGAERRIERLPWVARADVVRQWPSTVRIVVTERPPAAVVYAAGGFPPAVVDRQARVLDIGGDVPFGLITLTGLEGGLDEGGTLPPAMEPALRLGVRLNERLPGAVVAVNADLDATLATGGIVRFGSTDDLEEKLVALDAFLSEVDLTGLALLDLRVPSSPALRRQG